MGSAGTASLHEEQRPIYTQQECQLATDFEIIVGFMAQLQLEQALLSCTEGRQLVEAVLQAEGKEHVAGAFASSFVHSNLTRLLPNAGTSVALQAKMWDCS